jgi:glycosyltransferase involved in cell wall biosynthesis
MNIYYAQTMIFPNMSAHAIHTSMLAANLADQHVNVTYFPGVPLTGGKRILDDFFADLGFPKSDGLLLRHIPCRHKGLYGLLFRLLLWREAMRGLRAPRFFFASSVKEAVTALRIRECIPGGRGIPVIFEVHHLISKLKTGRKSDILYRYEKSAFARADCVIFISDTLRKDAEGYLPEPKNYIVSHLGFNDRIISPIQTTPSLNGCIRIVYCGSLQPGKGVPELVEAVSLLPEIYRLKIVGGRPTSALAALREQARRLGMADRVSFTGQISHSNVAAQLKDCDIFAIPMNTMNDFYCPMKMYEAVGYALPIVSTPLPSIREVLRNGVHALLSEDASPVKLSQALAALGENEELRRRMIRANDSLAQTLRASARAQFLVERLRTLLPKSSAKL